jgi:hypothetical protein
MISKQNLDGSKNIFGSPLGIASMALPGQTPTTNFKNIATAWKSNYNNLPGQMHDDKDENISSISYDDDKDLESYF